MTPIKEGIKNKEDREQAIMHFRKLFEEFKKFGLVGVVDRENNDFKFELVVRLGKHCVDNSDYDPLHEQAADIAQELINDFEKRKEGVQIAILELLESIVAREMAYDLAVQAIEKSMKFDGKKIQSAVVSLLKGLIKKGKAYSQAKEVSKKVIKIKDEDLQLEVLSLVEALIAKGEGDSDVKKTIESVLESSFNKVKDRAQEIQKKLSAQ